MKKIWLYIDEDWNGPHRNHVVGRRALEWHKREAYCYHCGGDIVYRSTGYISWPDNFDGQEVLASGVIHLTDQCPHCGKLNDPHARVYVEAFDAEDGEPIEYFISAMAFFSKADFDDYLKEYEEEGHLSFIVRMH
jgi:hypothetical protein